MNNDILYYVILFIYSFLLIFLFIKYYRWKINLTRTLPPNVDIKSYSKIILLKFISLFFVGFFLLSLTFNISKNAKEANQNREIIVAVDVSGSMLAGFLGINRLQAAKDLSLEIISFFNNNIALIAFAGNAYVMLPLIEDDALLSEYINNLSPNNFSYQGSNLEKVFEKALNTFTKNESSKFLFVLSDGEIFDGDNLKFQNKIIENKIKTVFISIGSPKKETVQPELYKHYNKPFQTQAEHQIFKELSQKFKGIHYPVINYSDIQSFKKFLETNFLDNKQIFSDFNRIILLVILLVLAIIVRF